MLSGGEGEMKKIITEIIVALCLFGFWHEQSLRGDTQQAVIFYSQGNYAKAIQELTSDMDKNPNWEFGHRLLGLCYLGRNENALAVNSLNRAVDLKSTSFSTYYGLGQAYFNMKQYEKSIGALNKAEGFAGKDKGSDESKDKAKLSKLRGVAYFRTGKYSDAAEDITTIIRAGQTDWSDYMMLGISYFNLNRNDEAIPALEKSLSLKPGQEAVTEALGKGYFKKGVSALTAKNYGAAISLLAKSRDYDSKNGYVYYNLGEAYFFDKKYAEAEKAFSKSAEIMPKNIEIFKFMGLTYEKMNKLDLALNAYKKAESISPSKELKDDIARVTENKKK
jgi:tetratricopeptide (TPR) repeat protein